MKIYIIIMFIISFSLHADFSDMFLKYNKKHKINKKRYSLITKPKKRRGYIISCYSGQGRAIPGFNSLKINSFKIEGTTISIETSDHRNAIVPINNCYIQEL